MLIFRLVLVYKLHFRDILLHNSGLSIVKFISSVTLGDYGFRTLR